MALRLDPLPAFNYMITLIDTSSVASALLSAAGGAVLGGFSECTGLETTLETFDYLEGGVNDQVHRFPSRVGYGNITLQRGVGLGEDLWLWHNGHVRGEGTRRDGLIILQDRLRIPIKTWHFTGGLPVKWTGPAFNAQSSEVSIESLEIAYEKLELFSPGALVGAALGAIGSPF